MRVNCDPHTDTLSAEFSSAPVAESDEEKLRVIHDYDATDNLVGLEVLDASLSVTVARTMQFPDGKVIFEECCLLGWATFTRFAPLTLRVAANHSLRGSDDARAWYASAFSVWLR